MLIAGGTIATLSMERHSGSNAFCGNRIQPKEESAAMIKIETDRINE
jgi:hypothetical protein